MCCDTSWGSARHRTRQAAQALLGADVLLGTAAGSTVAAQLGSGVSLDELFARQVSQEGGAHEIHPGVTIDAITELFLSAMLAPGATKEQKLQKIGAVALDTSRRPDASPNRCAVRSSHTVCRPTTGRSGPCVSPESTSPQANSSCSTTIPA